MEEQLILKRIFFPDYLFSSVTEYADFFLRHSRIINYSGVISFPLGPFWDWLFSDIIFIPVKLIT